ncbi:hypothetical protein [Enterococcus sp.]|uniref:hypothetical protein n=1 Tax=Enterococcus sp. TaxID=35783 RepID=UPI002898B952|nr:hypothetical protein [Enterococcus sp.]
MTPAVMMFVGFIFLMMLSVVVGKATDKKEQKYGGSYFMEQDGFDSGNNRNGDDKE